MLDQLVREERAVALATLPLVCALEFVSLPLMCIVDVCLCAVWLVCSHLGGVGSILA